MFLGITEDVDKWLDVVDLCLSSIYSYKDLRPVGFGDPERAIEELNIRFRQAGFGYQFEQGQIVRVDFAVASFRSGQASVGVAW